MLDIIMEPPMHGALGVHADEFSRIYFIHRRAVDLYTLDGDYLAFPAMSYGRHYPYEIVWR